MRHPRHLLSREELEALIASSAMIETREKTSFRIAAARLLKRIADRIAGHKLS